MRHTPIAGRLLVAAPVLTDPNFHRTVVLMLSHDLGGALGLILNRVDTEVPSTPVQSWVDRSPPPRSLFEGGPVQRDGLIGLMSTATETARTSPAREVFTEFSVFGGRTLGTVDLSVRVEDLAERGLLDTSVRVFRGYSGWGPGQLDFELTRPGWLVVDAHHDDAFTVEPEDLWRRVLGRQRGQNSWLAHFPDDLSAN